ncbi:MAG TPA: DUF488 domain-containing protein [Rhizomicrobium sp.]|jgi:uncharacterized protein YeaO (DUF488 family)
MPIKIKRVYEPAERGDGKRILVDRLWPRGVKKTAIDVWIKDVAPSDALRDWFHHEEPKWRAFRSKYRKELSANKDAVAELRKAAKGTATLLYGAKDEAHNQAVVLAEYLKGAKPVKKAKAPRKAKKAKKKT